MLSLREPRPSVGPHVPQPTTRTGLAFPARAPIPPHVTTPRERAPRVDGTAAEKHILGHLSSKFGELCGSPPLYGAGCLLIPPHQGAPRRRAGGDRRDRTARSRLSVELRRTSSGGVREG